MTEKNIIGQDIVYDLALSPTFGQDGICFAAKQSGLYRSGDGGQTWHTMYDTLEVSEPPLTTAVALSSDFADDNLVLVGVKGGILRTDDDGQTWRAMLFPPPAPLITTMVAAPGGVFVVGTAEDGIFCSTDRGMNWSAWNFGLLDLNVFSIAVSSDFEEDETLFAGTDSGIFRSTNGGRSWREVSFPPDAAPVISLQAVETGVLFAGTESHGLFYSEDGGKTWARRGAKVVRDMVNALVARFPEQTSDLALLTGTQLLISRDRGQTWEVQEDIESGAAVMVAAAQIALVGTVDGRVLTVHIE